MKKEMKIWKRESERGDEGGVKFSDAGMREPLWKYSSSYKS
jgi:hypothetical protein